MVLAEFFLFYRNEKLIGSAASFIDIKAGGTDRLIIINVPLGIKLFWFGIVFLRIMQGVDRNADVHSLLDVDPVVSHALVALAIQSGERKTCSLWAGLDRVGVNQERFGGWLRLDSDRID